MFAEIFQQKFIMKKRMKNKLLLPFAIITIALIYSCDTNSSDEKEYVGNWVEMSDYEGVRRSDAVAFSIGTKGYVGTGFDGDIRLNDFWEYDSERDSWLQVADFPGTAREGASAFSADNKGYVCLGYDGNNKLNDLYEFNPATNTWSQKTDFPGSARYGAISMTLNDKGYVGSGYDGNCLKDFWQYDPLTDTWTQKTSIGGGKRQDAVAFTLNGKGYVCTGIDNGSYETDFLEYDPDTDLWNKKKGIGDVTDESYDDDYSTIVGINKVAFAIGGKAYIATGTYGSMILDVWEWDPTTDLWELKTKFEGSSRTEAVSFIIGDRAFVTTGKNSSYYFDDLWEFKPFDEYNEYD